MKVKAWRRHEDEAKETFLWDNGGARCHSPLHKHLRQHNMELAVANDVLRSQLSYERKNAKQGFLALKFDR